MWQEHTRREQCCRVRGTWTMLDQQMFPRFETKTCSQSVVVKLNTCQFVSKLRTYSTWKILPLSELALQTKWECQAQHQTISCRNVSGEEIICYVCQSCWRQDLHYLFSCINTCTWYFYPKNMSALQNSKVSAFGSVCFKYCINSTSIGTVAAIGRCPSREVPL